MPVVINRGNYGSWTLLVFEDDGGNSFLFGRVSSNDGLQQVRYSSFFIYGRVYGDGMDTPPNSYI